MAAFEFNDGFLASTQQQSALSLAFEHLRPALSLFSSPSPASPHPHPPSSPPPAENVREAKRLSEIQLAVEAKLKVATLARKDQLEAKRRQAASTSARDAAAATAAVLIAHAERQECEQELRVLCLVKALISLGMAEGPAAALVAEIDPLIVALNKAPFGS